MVNALAEHKAAPQRVLGRRAPAAVTLHAARPALAIGGLGDAVEKNVGDRVTRREIGAAVSAEPG